MTHCSFAETIAGRYCRGSAGQRWIELVYRRSPALFVNWVVCRSHLVVQTWGDTAQRRPATPQRAAFNAARELRVMFAQRVGSADRGAAPKPAPSPSTAVATFVHRLQRIESMGRAPARDAATSAAPAALHPSHERVHRDHHAAATATDMPLASRAYDAAARSVPQAPARRAVPESTSSRAARAATLVPDAEIERLADRVIGTIDRRIVAQRERFGRP